MIIKLAKLHHKYFWSKLNLIVLFIMLGIIALSFFLSTTPFHSTFEKLLMSKIYLQNYQYNSMLSTKVILVLSTSFLMGSAFIPKNDAYIALYLSFNKRRMVYFYSKLLALFLFFLGMGTIIFFIYFLFGMLSTPLFIIEKMDLYFFSSIILLSILYGVLSIISVLAIKTNFAILLPFFLYLMSEFISSQSISSLLIGVHYFFPSLEIGSGYLIYGLVHLVLLIVFYCLIAGMIYGKKDFV